MSDSILIVGPAKDEGVSAEIVRLVSYSPTTIAFDWLQADGSYTRTEMENPLTFLKAKKAKEQLESEAAQ